MSSIISTCNLCKLSRGSTLDSILCNNEVFDVFFHPPLNSVSAQGNEPRGNFNIYLKSKDLIWVKIVL